MPIAETIAARIAEVASAEEGASEDADVLPSGGQGTEPTTTEVTTPPTEPDEVALASRARVAEIEAKLAESRARRQNARESNRARDIRLAAEADRKAAAEERAKYEGLRRGTFKETITALGHDPATVFAEMQREAVEAGTPEAQLRRMQEDFKRQIAENVEPLKKTIEQLEEERSRLAVEALDGRLSAAFASEVQDPEFAALRTEYEDADLLGYVRHFNKNPHVLVTEAKRYGVRLTRSDGKFTMREALTVLKSAQDAHEQGRQQRASRLGTAAPSAKQPTVNGTAPRGNAGQTIGNDVASERASPGPRLSRRERIEAEIERQERR